MDLTPEYLPHHCTYIAGRAGGCSRDQGHLLRNIPSLSLLKNFISLRSVCALLGTTLCLARLLTVAQRGSIVEDFDS